MDEGGRRPLTSLYEVVYHVRIGVDFGGSRGAPQNRETPMHLSVFTTFPPNLGLPTQYFWQVYASARTFYARVWPCESLASTNFLWRLHLWI